MPDGRGVRGSRTLGQRREQAGIVTGVPCNYASVETAIDHLSDQAPDTGTLRITFRSIPDRA